MGFILIFSTENPFRFTGITQIGIIVPALYVYWKVFAVKRGGRSLGLALGLSLYTVGGFFKSLFLNIPALWSIGSICKLIAPIFLALAILGILDKVLPPKEQTHNA